MAKLIFIQNPTLPSFEEWIAQLNIDLPDYVIPKSLKVDHWWEWASQFILNNNLDATTPLPTRTSYPEENDWRRWVLFVISSSSIFAIV